MRTIVINNPGPQGPVGPQGAPLSYKVYTALLTQSGGDNPQSLLSQDSPSLIIGVTYQITDDGGSGWDFTNVGAPNNDLNTSFVATGTTPANWGTNGMLSYNTGVPVVTVLENTIGNVWFTYENVGTYKILSDGLFTENKTWNNILVGDYINNLQYQEMFFNDASTFAIVTASEGTVSNGILYNTPIEIRVYN